MRTCVIGEKVNDYGTLLHTFKFSLYGTGDVLDNECCLFHNGIINHHLILDLVGQKFYPTGRFRSW